ncbi:hypothetical protein FACHB389_00180 [Nostoc calcicola FACHB-389]|nr:hypothetical protein [Nostoc calcicola FACHB-3891]OKH42620.1 hypothetical protein FACHB389_00180 [Nostoc calcicola FACHB-389]
MTNLCYWAKGLGIAISSAIVLSGNSTIAQINQDATLTNKPGVITQENIKLFEGVAPYGSNHDRSFEQFYVPKDREVTNFLPVIQFENPSMNFSPVIQFKNHLIISDWCPPHGICSSP